jgi:type I restriction enzyme S subunit
MSLSPATNAASVFHPVIYVSLPVRAISGGDRRLEGEVYLTGGHAIQQAIEKNNKSFAKLSDLALAWFPSRLKGVTVSSENGIPFLVATQVFDITPTPRKWLARGHTPELERRLVKPGWLLVARSGTENVGEVMITYSAHKGIAISDDLLRVEFNEPSDLGYVYAFLRGRYGRPMLRSSQYGSIIKHLEPEHLFSLPVPLAPPEMRRKASQQIATVFSLRDEAYRLSREAEKRYAKALGALPGPAPTETGYSVSSRDLSVGQRRLDGYYHNPAAALILAAIGKAGRDRVPLSMLADPVFSPNRFKRVHASAGVPYLSGEDLFKINPVVRKFVADPEDADRYYVRRGWILVACSGQIYGLNGSSVLADAWHENKVISHDLIRVVPKPGIRPGYLQMSLSHPVYGRPMVLRSAYGTSIPHLTPDDLKEFSVVRLSPTVEDEIADMVENASDLRADARKTEEAAVALVETAVADIIGELPTTQESSVAPERAKMHA